jgi:DNA end-binding protein Ku
MIELALHIVHSKASHFDPSKFEDRYETALKELLKRKVPARRSSRGRRRASRR